MGKKDYYSIQKNIEKITRGGYTNFLDPSILKKVISKLKGYSYKIYYPYKDSDKVIIYTDKIPKIRLLEVVSKEKLTHREIMGSLFGLNIDSEVFGDIIIYDNHYYIMVMDYMFDLIMKEYNMVGSKPINLKEVSFSILDNYSRQYQEIILIVSSLRVDNVISRLIGVSRDLVKKKAFDNEIILNYSSCHKMSYILNENDIFSVRKYGKYKFGGVIKNTKKDNYIIKIYKYIDN